MSNVIVPWKGYVKPFKILGNLYFVGTVGASTHIVDTGDGLIMFDSGYQHSLYLVIDNMYKLGLDVHDLKYIFMTHGHIDHFGATAALVQLTGAKTILGEKDRDIANGTVDLSYAKELDMEFNEFFEPDILVNDGDEITLGNTTVTAKATPGHTDGAMSYFFNVNDENAEFTAALHGGMGINTMCREFLDKYKLSYTCRDNFAAAMDRLSKEEVDIFLGNHTEHNDTLGKAKRIAEGDKYAFVVKGEWSDYCIWAKNNMLQMVDKEKRS